jgi:CubicO group peptidase (beta-lactamase class C family)
MTLGITGHCDPRFEAVKAVLADSIASGADLGASFAATVNGEMVIDIWGGRRDEKGEAPWDADTITNVYSTTKTMSFLCALLLADRGELDFDSPVARYWPEFAANGKSQIKVWHLLNHAAGLSGLDQKVSADDLYDWDKITGLLAAQAPWWEPGSASGYHALTQGYLIGEVVRRITGQSLGVFFAAEIAGPLDADFYIGVPDAVFPRICDLVPPEGDNGSILGAGDEASIAARTFSSPVANALDSRTDAWRRAEIPAANGHGNARAVAKIHALLACDGETQGKRLLSAATTKMIMAERISGTDLVLGVPMAFGLGFGLNNPKAPVSPNANTCFWGGWGGSIAIIDQDARCSIAYVMNKMHQGLMGDSRGGALVKAFYASLGEQ